MQCEDSNAGRAMFAAEHLRHMWLTQAEPPAVATFLAEVSHLPPRSLLDVLLVDQQLRWRTAQPLTTNDYLGLCPATRRP